MQVKVLDSFFHLKDNVTVVRETQKSGAGRRLEKREAALKSDFVVKVKQHMRGAVILRHEDVRTAGIPDISITFDGRTTWWEAKHATPGITTYGIQELTMLRLAKQGFARYLIWYESAIETPCTLIVNPVHFGSYKTMHEASFDKFNSDTLFHYIRKVHSL